MAVTQDRSQRFHSISNGSSVYTWTSPASTAFNDYVNMSRTRTGERVLHWKQKIKNGQNATSNLLATFESIDCSSADGIVTYYQKSNPTVRAVKSNFGDMWVSNSVKNRRPEKPFPSGMPSDVYNQARTRFYKNLRQVQQQFSAGTFFGEFAEVVHMFRHPASALHSSANGYLDALSKRKRASPKHWLKSASGLWLEHSFGWLPFINDCRDASKALQRLSEPRQTSVQGSAQVKLDVSKNYDSAGKGIRQFNNGCAFDQDTRLYYTGNVRYKAGIRAQVVTNLWQDFSLFGFNPRDFIPTAWELLPWSFLVDYATNIGDVLNSAVTDTSDIVYYVETVRSESELFALGTIAPESTNPQPGTFAVASYSGGPGRCLCKRKELARTAVGGVPLPSLRFSMDLSSGQLLNVAALLGGARSLHSQSYPNRRKA